MGNKHLELNENGIDIARGVRSAMIPVMEIGKTRISFM